MKNIPESPLTKTPSSDPGVASIGADSPMGMSTKCPCCGQAYDPNSAMPMTVMVTVNPDGTATLAPENEANEPDEPKGGLGGGMDEQAMIGQAAGGKGLLNGGL